MANGQLPPPCPMPPLQGRHRWPQSTQICETEAESPGVAVVIVKMKSKQWVDIPLLAWKAFFHCSRDGFRWTNQVKWQGSTHSNPPGLKTAIQVPANWRPWLQGLGHPDWARPSRMPPLHPGSPQGVGQPAKALTCPSEGLLVEVTKWGFSDIWCIQGIYIYICHFPKFLAAFWIFSVVYSYCQGRCMPTSNTLTLPLYTHRDDTICHITSRLSGYPEPSWFLNRISCVEYYHYGTSSYIFMAILRWTLYQDTCLARAKWAI